MSDNSGGTLKIAEKQQKAKREWRKKVDSLVKQLKGDGTFIQETAESACVEYMKIFGRIGIMPLLHVKDGKQRPRYLLDRNDIWVMYKPPLWAMGGFEKAWKERMEELITTKKALNLCQQEMLDTDKAETLYVWHGLAQGLKYIDQNLPVPQWGFVQRLDQETDGPVIVAKTWRGARFMQMQLKEHILNKGYMCLVHGRVDNYAQELKARFVECGADAKTQIMLKYDEENDPFFDWSDSKRWTGRSVKMAETFFKPIAYYRRPEDNSEYTLVYVNILSGITHQIRITMQTVGHPLVSDDRYLPKDQAMKDLKWCPRNFLTEVRSDFFDFGGPHKDPDRMRCTRISIENPLPQLLQDVLEKKLELVEKLDPTADLYVGCQHWAIGDEQLMISYPKDSVFRQKVMRWGARRGIHLDALDRLLLLPKDEIEGIIQSYVPPGDKGNQAWVCNECMMYNRPTWEGMKLSCGGGAGYRTKKDHEGKRNFEACTGAPIVDEKDAEDMPNGWLDYTSDPTYHMLLQIHGPWLDARRKILKGKVPAWSRPPEEPEGALATEDMMESLHSALVLNVKAGGYGINEQDLKELADFKDVPMPLQLPEDGPIRRMRLPGKGSFSTWTYALKSKELLKYTSKIDTKTKKLFEPCHVETDRLPRARLITADDKLQAEKTREKEERLEAKRAAKRKAEEAESTAWLSLVDEDGPSLLSPQAKKPKPENSSGGAWRRVESRSNPGQFYYYNDETKESSMEPPAGMAQVKEAAKPRNDSEEDGGIPWERKESSSKPGNFYYFNPQTGQCDVNPPRVSHPWQLKESTTKRGQFYYFNTETGAQRVDPPRCARPASTLSQGTNKPSQDIGKSKSGDTVWEKKESGSHKGKFYYLNLRNPSETTWDHPPLSQVWEKKESSSNPGKFYYMNLGTGERSWDAPEKNGKS